MRQLPENRFDLDPAALQCVQFPVQRRFETGTGFLRLCHYDIEQAVHGMGKLLLIMDGITFRREGCV